jgi:ELWxxDGT repeat protein
MLILQRNARLLLVIIVIVLCSAPRLALASPHVSPPGQAELFFDTLPGSNGGAIGAMLGFKGQLFFATYSPTNTGLWRSDSTSATVYKIFNHRVSYLTPVGDWLYFVGFDAVNGSTLWRTDGTIRGTRQVADPIPHGQRGWITDLFALGDRVLMKVYNVEYGAELWVSNGSAESTQLLRDIAPGVRSSNPASVQRIGSIAYFFAFDGNATALWRTDGTPAGTSAVRSLHSGPSSQALARVLGDSLYFQSGASERRLWRSDGTAEGTLAIGSYGTIIHMAAWQQELAFLTETKLGEAELWTSDGTAVGTKRLLALSEAGRVLSAADLFGGDDALYFTSWEAKEGYSLWRSDGTAAGTRQQSGLRPFYGATTHLLDGTTLYLSASEGSASPEIWRLAAIDSRAVQLSQIQPDKTGTTPEHLTFVGDTLFFVADDGVHGRELWRLRLPAFADSGATLYLPMLMKPKR